jgi:hypothetical protein
MLLLVLHPLLLESLINSKEEQLDWADMDNIPLFFGTAKLKLQLKVFSTNI